MEFDLFDNLIWFLPDAPSDDIKFWADKDMILCRTEILADAIADLIEAVSAAQGVETLVRTSYYDPDEDEREGCVDKYTGWWCVDVD